MSASTSLSPVSAPAFVNSKIQELEEVYFIVSVHSGMRHPLSTCLALVFSSEKTAQAVKELFTKGTLYPEVYLPDGVKEERCWGMELEEYQFKGSWGVPDTIQKVLDSIEKKVPSNDKTKEFPVTVRLPSLI